MQTLGVVEDTLFVPGFSCWAEYVYASEHWMFVHKFSPLSSYDDAGIFPTPGRPEIGGLKN